MSTYNIEGQAPPLIKLLNIKWKPGRESSVLPEIRKLKQQIESEAMGFSVFCITGLHGYRSGIFGKAISYAAFFAPDWMHTYVLRSSHGPSDLDLVAWGISRVNRYIPIFNFGVFDPKRALTPAGWFSSNFSHVSAFSFNTAILDSGCALLSNSAPDRGGFIYWENTTVNEGITWGLYGSVLVAHAHIYNKETPSLNVAERIEVLCKLVSDLRKENETSLDAWVFLEVDVADILEKESKSLADAGLFQSSHSPVGVIYRGKPKEENVMVEVPFEETPEAEVFDEAYFKPKSPEPVQISRGGSPDWIIV